MIGGVLVPISRMASGSSMASALLVAVFPSNVEFWEVMAGGGLCTLSFEKYEKVFHDNFMLVVKHSKIEIFYI